MTMAYSICNKSYTLNSFLQNVRNFEQITNKERFSISKKRYLNEEYELNSREMSQKILSENDLILSLRRALSHCF